jgi:signal transduction histidine kinase
VAHQRLIQSEKLAVIGQLSGSLAHEINNPLQAIRSGLGWVLSEVEVGRTESIRPDLTIILDEVDRMEALFRQMFDFYRPTVFEHTPLDLNVICQSAKTLIQKRLEQNHAHLSLHLDPQLPLTCGDSNQVKQVLLNLLLNAAEALPPDGGHIQVSTTSDPCWVLLQVQDNGAGIALDHQQHLFEPLFTTKIKGLGLGLAISREIIERHHGTIQVESHLAQGSTFSIRLPIRRACDETHLSGG